jgi:hypothetical protein
MKRLLLLPVLGWVRGISTPPMQLQRNGNRRALLRILYTKIKGKLNKNHAYLGERTQRAVGLGGVRRVA